MKLPIHWMWWPMIGGLVVGIGGLIEPHALGVGYDNIAAHARRPHGGDGGPALLAVKAVIWAVALGSGTSGGVLAPLLIIGGAMGASLGGLLPAADPGFWPLLAMAATMGGTMRAPLTATFFAVELTGNTHVLVPLIAACATAHAVTVLLMKRSILTEKIARRGHHIFREYRVDPFALTSACRGDDARGRDGAGDDDAARRGRLPDRARHASSELPGGRRGRARARRRRSAVDARLAARRQAPPTTLGELLRGQKLTARPSRRISRRRSPTN